MIFISRFNDFRLCRGKPSFYTCESNVLMRRQIYILVRSNFAGIKFVDTVLIHIVLYDLNDIIQPYLYVFNMFDSAERFCMPVK